MAEFYRRLFAKGKEKSALKKGPSGFPKKGKYKVDTKEHAGASRIQFENVKSGKTTGYTAVDSSADDYKVYKTKGGKTKEISKKKYKRQIGRKLNKQV
jgi:hypothetical protein